MAANRLHGSIEALVTAADRHLAQTQFEAPDPREAVAALPQAEAA